MRLCFAKDRLYLLEQNIYEGTFRILVLSLQGDILQVVKHLTLPTADFDGLCCFDDKLLAHYHYLLKMPAASSGFLPTHGILALQGL